NKRSSTTTTTTSGAKPEMSQSQVLNKLHKVSLSHVELGNLAQTHAKSDKVKSLGEKMSKDFGKIDQTVVDYAKEHDIVLAEATSMGHKGTKAGSQADMKTGTETMGNEAQANNDIGNKVGESTTGMDEARSSKMERLGKLQGEEFDKAFLTETI